MKNFIFHRKTSQLFMKKYANEILFCSLGIPTNIKKILNIKAFKKKVLIFLYRALSLDMKVKIVQSSLAISFTSTPPCRLYQYKNM